MEEGISIPDSAIVFTVVPATTAAVRVEGAKKNSNANPDLKGVRIFLPFSSWHTYWPQPPPQLLQSASEQEPPESAWLMEK